MTYDAEKGSDVTMYIPGFITNMQDLRCPRRRLSRMSSSGIQKPSSYFKGDRLRLRYRAQPVNAM
jgi:hypothetical protein